MSKEAIGFIPAGSMNFALAKKALENGYSITFWFHTGNSLRRFQDTREIKQLLGEKFPDSPNVTCTADIGEALRDKKIIFFAPRSWDLREVLMRARPHMRSDSLLIDSTKGFDEYEEGFYTPSQVFEQVIPHSKDRLAVISGPNFAGQIFRGAITATMVAAHDKRIAQAAREILMGNNNGESKDFLVKIYKGNPQDIEIVGAFKNVVGLVMGFARTLDNYDENTGGAILTEGLEEAKMLCKSMGRSSRATSQLPGIGDYGLLMNSTSSRNVEAGENFGKGIWDIEYLMDPEHTIEGVRTVKAVRYLAGKWFKHMPLAAYAYEILYRGMNPRMAVKDLLSGKTP